MIRNNISDLELKEIIKESREIQQEKDKDILNALLHGNHLNNLERERANKLLYLLNIELKRRI